MILCNFLKLVSERESEDDLLDEEDASDSFDSLFVSSPSPLSELLLIEGPFDEGFSSLSPSISLASPSEFSDSPSPSCDS